jgi:hypothetical protein
MRYTGAASYEQRLRASDVIPQRPVVLVANGLLGAALVAGLIGLDAYQPQLATQLGRERLEAFELAAVREAAGGGVAVWFASLMLTLAGLVSALIFSLRRHRIDDYHGRYRIWLWAAVAWFALSLNTSAGLHRLLVEGMAQWTGWNILPGGALWWLAPATGILATLGTRLLLEVFECRLAFATILLSFLFWGVAVVQHLGLIGLAANPAATNLAVGGAILAGHWLLLSATVIYARHVILDAEGLRAVGNRRRKRTRARGDTGQRSVSAAGVGKATPSPASAVQELRLTGREGSTPDTSRSTRNHDHSTPDKPQSVPRPSVAQWTDGSDGYSDRYDDDGDPQHARKLKLSKADRKRLRHDKRQERHAA